QDARVDGSELNVKQGGACLGDHPLTFNSEQSHLNFARSVTSAPLGQTHGTRAAGHVPSALSTGATSCAHLRSSARGTTRMSLSARIPETNWSRTLPRAGSRSVTARNSECF